ncbi:cold shock domain-containing protein [Allorhodopirellula solitaria]|uniref:Cold-shock DNA-binding domain protein n=1 Tax=Allorhodopirellula solitaria TaxID=2527987 RepID=A0A5C5YJT7_9BACT|nr:cold shock domain-containing protein [Allorhodopirellula solitaria]TWT75155.1 Cold-shock DNA-binding domain protein [Allorhodopirellula solitaria]
MSERPLSGFSSRGRSRDEDDEEKKKPFRIQKKRLGEIKYIRDDGEFGFIQAEDFREDVFFHKMSWDGDPRIVPQNEMYVEFELDDDHYEATQKLRAKVVRPTHRPSGRKLKASDSPYEIVFHHPRARRKRPTWREDSADDGS